MRLSIARTSAGGSATGDAMKRDDVGFDVRAATWRRMALVLSAILVLGSIGIVFGSSKPAGAATVFAPGQVFASVGASTVNVYDPTSGDQVDTLNDGTNEPFTAGSAFDASGNLYVTDDINGTISEYSPTGNFDGTFASGLTNPLSLVFDNRETSTWGSRARPTSPSSTRPARASATSGPSRPVRRATTGSPSPSDECTFYYTTETDVIYRYNKCTNTQLSTFNVAPFTGDDAYELQILPNGNVLVADSESDIMLDPNGNVIGSYSCSPTFRVAPTSSSPSPSIPSGTSFWTGDTASGIVYRIDIASGDVSCRPSTPGRHISSASASTTRSRWPTPPPTTTPCRPL